LQCKWQAGKQRLRGIRAMNLPLSRLGSSIRNTPISQPSCYLALTCLTNRSITTSLFGWRAHSELCHFPALPLQGKKSQHAQRYHGYSYSSRDTTPPLTFLFVVACSTSGQFLRTALAVKLPFWQVARDSHNHKTPPKILCPVSVPFLAQLHPRQDLG